MVIPYFVSQILKYEKICLNQGNFYCLPIIYTSLRGSPAVRNKLD